MEDEDFLLSFPHYALSRVASGSGCNVHDSEAREWCDVSICVVAYFPP
jgi:hypothetical protein